MPVEISYYKGNNYFAIDNRKYGTKSSTGMKMHGLVGGPVHFSI